MEGAPFSWLLGGNITDQDQLFFFLCLCKDCRLVYKRMSTIFHTPERALKAFICAMNDSADAICASVIKEFRNRSIVERYRVCRWC